MSTEFPLLALSKNGEEFAVSHFSIEKKVVEQRYFQKLQIEVAGEIKSFNQEVLQEIINKSPTLQVGDEPFDWNKISISGATKPDFLNMVLDPPQDTAYKELKISGLCVCANIGGKKYILIEDIKPADKRDHINFICFLTLTKNKAEFKDYDEPTLVISKTVDLIYDVEQQTLYFQKLALAKKFFAASTKEFEVEIDAQGLTDLLPLEYFSYKNFNDEPQKALDKIPRTLRIKLYNVLNRNHIADYLATSATRKKLFNYLKKKINADENCKVLNLNLGDNDKFVLPDYKPALKIMIKALDEDYFEGALSKASFVSNSKQRLAQPTPKKSS